MTLPAIFGLSGPSLAPDERAFFADANPLGFILFARNCEDPRQVRALCHDLRTLTGRADTPVLIDQEGGRVARLKPPHWRHPPPAALFGALWDIDQSAARRAIDLNARLIAADLAACGINVDCAPMLDVPVADSHGIVGDRAFHRDPAVIAALGGVFAASLIEGGVLPVMKHIPGHGRARADSHAELPVVSNTRGALAQDFAPFAALADLPLAMTAHILYAAVDRRYPATTSARLIGEVIRGEIGFGGLLMSDDISSNMKALPGTFAERARDSIAAGCDVVLHCDGDLAAMHDVAAALPPLSDQSAVRWAKASFLIAGARPAAVSDDEADELAGLLAPVRGA